MDFVRVREFYQNKKRTWANTLSDYTPPKPWGEYYGYDLAPPVPIAEIIAYEKLHKFKLPKALKRYLTKVSREIFVDAYPSMITLPDKPGYCSIPIDEYIITEDGDWSVTDGMITIGEGVCRFTDCLIINGIGKGNIWHNDGESLYSKRKTFLEYVMEQLDPKPMKPIRLDTSEDLKNLALSINFLLILSGDACLRYDS